MNDRLAFFANFGNENKHIRNLDSLLVQFEMENVCFKVENLYSFIAKNCQKNCQYFANILPILPKNIVPLYRTEDSIQAEIAKQL